MKSKTYKNWTKKHAGLMYDHMIFHTKYNRKVLTDKIRIRCEEIMRNVLDEYGCKCIEISVQPNHVHLLVGIPHNRTPSKVVGRVKGISSRWLRREFPVLVEEIPKVLWAPSCTHQSVGGDPRQVISYIKNQDRRHGRRK